MESFIEADFCATNGRTRLARLSCAAPLKIAKTFALPDGGVSVVVMDASPGMLAGDRYRTEWRLDAGARVEVGAQGFTRVFPARQGAPCTLETRLLVASGAVLDWNPQPLVLHRDADLRAQTQVHLGAGATLLASEIWCAGRALRGELFDFAAFQNSWRVYREGAPPKGSPLVFASSLDFVPALLDPRAPGIFGEWTHAGNFWAFTPEAQGGSGESLKNALWDILESDTPLARSVYGGATCLGQGGVMMSLLGRRAFDVQAIIALGRAAARRQLFES